MLKLKTLCVGILCLLFLPIGAQNITTPEQTAEEEERWGRIIGDIIEGSQNTLDTFYYVLKHDTAYTRPDFSRQSEVQLALNRSGFQLPIDTLRPLIVKTIQQWNMSLDQYDPENAVHLQLFALELGHRAARREHDHPDAKQIMIESMRTLYIQKGIDMDAMAQLLLEIKNDISTEEYDLYLDYVKGMAEECIANFETKLQEKAMLMQEQKEGADLKKAKAYLESKHVVSNYCAAKRALVILASSAATSD